MRSGAYRVLAPGMWAIAISLGGFQDVPPKASSQVKSLEEFVLNGEADENSAPFSLNGRPAASTSVLPVDYQQSISKFPNARACLPQSEAGKKMPSVAKIDSQKIDNPKDLDVCLFRVLTGLQDETLSLKWLYSNGFVASFDSKRYADTVRRLKGVNVPRPYKLSVDKHTYSGMMAGSKFRIDLRWFYSVTGLVEFGSSGKLISVQLVPNSL